MSVAPHLPSPSMSRSSLPPGAMSMNQSAVLAAAPLGDPNNGVAVIQGRCIPWSVPSVEPRPRFPFSQQVNDPFTVATALTAKGPAASNEPSSPNTSFHWREFGCNLRWAKLPPVDSSPHSPFASLKSPSEHAFPLGYTIKISSRSMPRA